MKYQCFIGNPYCQIRRRFTPVGPFSLKDIEYLREKMIMQKKDRKVPITFEIVISIIAWIKKSILGKKRRG